MEFRHLRTLIAVAEHGGFAAAGEEIGLTQSAVSLHVKALEDSLGASLFDRTRRPPVLTARGAALVERAREILRLCAEAKESVEGETYSGVLEVGAIPTVLTGVLPASLAAMKAAHPSLQIRVASGLSGELVRRVYKGSLDAAIVTEPAQLAAGMSWHPFASEPLMVIAPGDSTETTDRALLESRPFIRFRRFAWAEQLIDGHIRDRGINVRSSMEVDSLEAIALMVAHDLGISVVPHRHIVQPFPPNVRAVPFGRPPVQRVVGLIERTSNPRGSLVKALHEVLLGECAPAGDLDR